MGFKEFFLGPELPAVQNQSSREVFSLAIGSDPATYMALVGLQGHTRVSRSVAKQVPALKRARDLIAGTIATFPLHAINSAKQRVSRKLFEQPEGPGIPRVVTIARTVEDLFWDGYALWEVVERADSESPGFPSRVKHHPYGTWNQDTKTGDIRVGAEVIKIEDCILFISPNDPVLEAAASMVFASRRLEAAALLNAENPEPYAYFQPTQGQQPDPEAIKEFLTAFNAARKDNKYAYVPGDVEIKQLLRSTGEELQNISAREFTVLESSRITGVDADWLGVNTTTRTYQNSQDSRVHFKDFVLMPYLLALELRLSDGDVTPRGQFAKFNMDAFLRGSTTERYANYAVGISNNFVTVDEVRDSEDLPPLPPDDTPPAAPEGGTQ